MFGFPFIKKSFRVFTRKTRKTSSSAFYEKHDGFRRRKERRQRRTHQLESEGSGSFLVVVVVVFVVLVFKRSLLLLLLLLLLGLFFRKRAFSLFEKSLSPISPSFLCCSNETQISLSFSLKKQDNAEVHFKVKMGTKFKKVRVRVFRLLFFERRREENWIRDFYQPPLRHSLTFFLFLSRVFIYKQNRSSTRSCSANLSNPGPFDSYSTGKELERTKRRKSWTWKTATRWTS